MAKKNDVLIVETEFNRLMKVAEAMEQRNPVEAEPLLAKLDTALTVAEAKVPDDLVRLGSSVVYSLGELEKTVSIVFPADADIDAGRVAVTSPLGVALLGRRAGVEVVLRARDGKETPLTIVAVKSVVEFA
jgi:regulator of nucleoside diphosphate kinase